MKLSAAFLLSVILLGVSTAHVYADGDAIGRVSYALSPMFFCPDRVWPGYSWRKLQVLLVDTEAQKGFLWNDQDNEYKYSIKSSPVPYSEVPDSFKLPAGSYQTGEFRGSKTLFLSVSSSLVDDVGLAVHEAFHFIGPVEVPKSEQAHTRGADYPEKWKPRYLRSQVIDNLYKAFDKASDGGLCAASFWWRQWKKEYPDEVSKTAWLDLDEGVAEYVGAVGGAVGVFGCQATESQIQAQLKEYIELRYQAWSSPAERIRDVEPYLSGILACSLLRMKNTQGWQARVWKGETPLEVLLTDVPPVPQKDDPKLIAQVKGYCKDRNDEMAKTVVPFPRRLHSPEYRLLVLPMSWIVTTINGSLCDGGGFISTKDGKVERSLMMGMSARFESLDHSQSVEFLHADMEDDAANPWGLERVLIVPLPKKALTHKDDGSYSIDLPTVKAKGLKPEIRTHGDQEWLFLDSAKC